MARFVFRLEVLLNMRKRAEEAAQRSLAEAINLLEMEKQKLVSYENILAENVMNFSEKQKQPIPVDEFRLSSLYIEKLNQEIERQKQVIVSVGRNVLEKRAQLQKAVQDRQIVEKLREKRLEQYNFEQLQEEQKLLDEMGTQRAKKVSN